MKTLDEAIEYHERMIEVVPQQYQHEHAQLADWLKQLKTYDENVNYLLDTTDKAVRSRQGGGLESLVESLCINYIALRNSCGRTKKV